MEDLLPFSDETLCRAVAEATTPVVSAIGHEPDTPILDYVADWRASTPTEAGKKVVPDLAEEHERVRALRERAWRVISGRLEREERGLADVMSRPAMADPYAMVEDRAEDVSALLDRSRRVLEHRLARAEDALAHTRARVVALSPAATLQRGYAVLQHEDGRVVRDAAGVTEGDALRARVAEGEFGVTVTPRT